MASNGNNADLCERIRICRLYSGHSDELAFALKLGITLPEYRKIETGKEMSGHVMLQFIAITGANPKYLLNGDKPVLTY